MKKICLLALLFVVLFALAVVPARAQNMPVRATIQATIFKRVVMRDLTLVTRQSTRMLLVYDAASADRYQEILSAFEKANLTVTAISEEQVASLIGAADVVYLMPGVTFKGGRGVLTLTGSPALVESGLAAVGVGLKDGKPEIIVHTAQLAVEGHELSADLLKLARLI